MAKVKNEAATSKPARSSSAEFERTVGKLLATPPKAHDEMKKGAGKRMPPDARSSGKGAKG